MSIEQSSAPEPSRLPEGNASGTTGTPAATARLTDAGAGVKAAAAAVVPKPTRMTGNDEVFVLTERSAIVTMGAADQVRIAEYLATILRRSTGFPMPVVIGNQASGNIVFSPAGGDVGDEGYGLEVTASSVRLSSHYTAGYFYGVQSLRQLFPAQVESATVVPGPWAIPGGTIEDSPRYGWRGAMLDVSRHFFSVDEVKRYVDDIALYKINVLHLHLSDDQGWRIEIASWPKLTELGGRYEVGGGKGGFYSKADYQEIVAYAQSRHVTIVPEIDLPGHTNAALASYPELNCDGKAPKPYTGTDVGFSAVCVDSEATYRFVTDVVAELAAMTPGEYIHVGGDEVEKLTQEEYAGFVERVDGIVTKAGKKTIGWAEIGAARIAPESVVQFWNTDTENDDVRDAVERGARVLMSPASKSYLDMKYDDDTENGLKWAGLIEVKDAWDWDPGTFLDYVPADRIVGVEAPMWTETLTNIEDVEELAFPRLPAIAEVGWSAPDGRDWEDFRRRLAAQGRRWDALGITYHPSPQIDWVK